MDQPTYETNPLFNEVLYSARYLVNNEGGKTDVVLSLAVWNKLLTLLEELDDRNIVQAGLPKLKAGPVSSGVLRWEEVREGWEDDTSV
ncbi:MAG: hypothetical protein DRR08_07935 [Candidatus Parabeggiatoa sp. nov. 2]|nr:MAG: hypothetical protein B6247_16245 [Beggiatoa sp. 4572_84]RKZ61735.1 MAG: hypothetical protein DRR08_07935 [Gammaproteobacteria bacterium]